MTGTTTIRFLTKNSNKIREVSEILGSFGVAVTPLSLSIDELQTEDETKLVRDKVLKGFRRVGRPLLVEHTGLHLTHLNGLPGGLTQVFWDRLKADRFCELFGNTTNTSAVAKTSIAYADGKQFHCFSAEIQGRISPTPRGSRDFQWDCVFIPEPFTQTFAELGPRKNEISMRRRALEQFVTFLQNRA